MELTFVSGIQISSIRMYHQRVIKQSTGRGRVLEGHVRQMGWPEKVSEE